MNHKIAALIVAGTGKNWARHQLRERGYSDLAVVTVVDNMRTSTGNRVSGNVLAIIQILKTLNPVRGCIDGLWETV